MWWWWWLWWSSSSSSTTAAATLTVAIFYLMWQPSVGHHTEQRTTASWSPLDEWSARHRLYLTTHNAHNRQTSVLLVEFEPTISAGMWPQTYALDRVATGTCSNNISTHNIPQAVSQSHTRFDRSADDTGKYRPNMRTKKCIAITGMPPLLQGFQLQVTHIILIKRRWRKVWGVFFDDSSVFLMIQVCFLVNQVCFLWFKCVFDDSSVFFGDSSVFLMIQVCFWWFKCVFWWFKCVFGD